MSYAKRTGMACRQEIQLILSRIDWQRIRSVQSTLKAGDFGLSKRVALSH